MPRIVAGRAKGRPLAVPPKGTRPTSDRAREGLFNTLAGLVDLDGGRVLDLFAGSGAVGLEALSRGAAAATFVESDRTAAVVLQRNVAAVGLGPSDVVRLPAETYLAATPAGPFRFVFADPPYAVADLLVDALVRSLARPGWLEPGGVVVVERSARGPGPVWPEALEPLKQKRYGEGMLWYGRMSDEQWPAGVDSEENPDE
jgi:16S rRNA (guanine966-N2)-methyltransferase